MRPFNALLALAVLAAACSETSVPVSPIAADDTPAASRAAGSDRWIVVFHDDVADVRGAARAKAARVGGSLHYTYTSALRGFAGVMSEGAANSLRGDPDVAWVERDQPMTAFTTQSGATWGLDRTDQRALPLSGSWSYTATGSGVTAYIVDTGIEIGHPDLGGRASVGYDAIGDGRNGIDCNGHGTHVSGTVGGNVYGIAKGVRLVAVRVLDCGGSGSTAGVIAGVDWVTANHATPAVANMSLGGSASTSLDAAVKRSIASGVAYGIAAGNGNIFGWAEDACTKSPARVAEAMTIGATSKTDAKTSWSNYGNCVDWFAPGLDITSDWLAGATRTISGTSMATPHVVGVAALYLQGNPGATPQQVRDALYASTTKGVVTGSKSVNNHLLYSNY